MPAGLSEQAETSSGLGKEQGAAANLLVGLQAKLGQKGERFAYLERYTNK
jgi:hypothetical protein